MLTKQNPKVLVTELPILQIVPMEASKLKLSNTFKAPVYTMQDRRNAMGEGLVFEADLATGETPAVAGCVRSRACFDYIALHAFVIFGSRCVLVAGPGV